MLHLKQKLESLLLPPLWSPWEVFIPEPYITPLCLPSHLSPFTPLPHASALALTLSCVRASKEWLPGKIAKPQLGLPQGWGGKLWLKTNQQARKQIHKIKTTAGKVQTGELQVQGQIVQHKWPTAIIKQETATRRSILVLITSSFLFL